MRLLAASLNLPASTPMVAAPLVPAVGTKVALYWVGLICTQLLNAPPVTETSPTAKLVLASDRVNTMVSPALPTVPVPERVTATVGAVVSLVPELVSWTQLLVSAVVLVTALVPAALPLYVSALALPAASVNLALSTPMRTVPAVLAAV